MGADLLECNSVFGVFPQTAQQKGLELDRHADMFGLLDLLEFQLFVANLSFELGLAFRLEGQKTVSHLEKHHSHRPNIRLDRVYV